MRVDKLVVEGTNLGVGRTPLLADEGLRLMERIMTSSLTITTTHYLDLEFLRAVVKASQGSEVLIASKLMSEFVTRDMFRGLQEPLVAEEYVKGVPDLEMASVFVLKSYNNPLIVTSYHELINLVRTIKRWFPDLTDVAVILSEPEPRQEESVDYGVLLRWMDALGVVTYRIRVSGHYYPFELPKLLSLIRPREVIPIHTEHPELLLALSRYS